ncbi:hypothetical protein FHX74_000809 [Friedmanniella endophytica]|uniref:FAD-dependent oxidoreductase 2 FAD-binding domain-containing protein n=1 Tax=Microlunatus kandeliicorticis TaxID=1759536 RepID=A0A7W3P4V5_9ACTN|nr:FAD-binding dehydrogenase [Microlunatus kandeliicorticis]MBA8793215.1 hypothetical protein [Microlunatus kandeliicorticis]
MDADVIVVGAGLAGLVTAAGLAARRRRVLLLDAEPLTSLGGQAHWSFGGLFLVGSPEQRRLGVRDSAGLALADWLGSAGFDRDSDYWPRRWAEAYVDFAAGEKRSWLHGLGVRFFPVVQWAERGGYAVPGHGNTVPRFHVTWGTGPGLVAPFADAVLGSDHVTVRARHRVTGLTAGADGVEVTGEVLAPSSVERGRPSPRTVVGGFVYQAGAVVVAGGGIGGDLDQVRRNWPTDWGVPPDDLICGVPDHVDGSMLRVTTAAGGRVINPDRMWHYPEGLINHSPLWTRHGIRILPGPSSLWLDASGHRLPAPLYPGFDALGATRHIARTGRPWSWFVLDRAILGAEFALSGSEQNADLTGRDVRRLVRDRLGPGPTPEVQAFLERGVDFVTAGTVRELVARMNALTGGEDLVDADQVLDLVRARDAQVRSGLGKDPQVVATSAARRYVVDRLMRVSPPHPLLATGVPGADPDGRVGDHGPLIAVRLHLLTRKTLGGLETDLDSRVLQPDGTPLPGVYAVGEAAGFGGGGVHGYRSLEGTFLGGCLFTGRRAAAAL